MAIKIRQRKGGYSTTTAQDYISPNLPIYSLSTELEIQQKFEDGKPTGEILGYKAYFIQEGLEPFQVKFADKPQLPSFLSTVRFEGLEACEVAYSVYFRARDVMEAIK